MTLQGILLDVDGTLILSNDAHANAWVEAFAAFGHPISYEQVRPLIGMGGDQIIPMLTPGLSDQEGEGKKISTHRRATMVEQLGPTLSPTKGARQLVEKLQQDGYSIVVASSASPEELEVLLEAADIKDLLSDVPVTSSSDAETSKPAPDIVSAALKRGGFEPNQVVMIGDSPYDVAAANTAGVEVIMFRCGGFNDSELEGAIAIYDDPADLLAHYDRSPLGTKTLKLVEQ
ncbi:MAG: HAD family hydrolase [Myxacorys californica WJT36-NPBG1]|jgi:HAD superfamily hydrolase (TIGR01509 family)|nr:HAD family hydrolase [Myxacorys californica WJT36-NPBG1]